MASALTLEKIPNAGESQLIELLALSDDTELMGAARQELEDRAFGPKDVDLEIELYFDRRAADNREYWQASAEGWL